MSEKELNSIILDDIVRSIKSYRELIKELNKLNCSTDIIPIINGIITGLIKARNIVGGHIKWKRYLKR